MSSEKLQKLADTKFDIKAAKLNLLELVDSQLTFTYAGGLFKATPELLAEITALLSLYNEDQDVVILDEYKTPIEVTLSLFQTIAVEARQYALYAYLNEYEALKKVRKGDKL